MQTPYSIIINFFEIGFYVIVVNDVRFLQNDAIGHTSHAGIDLLHQTLYAHLINRNEDVN